MQLITLNVWGGHILEPLLTFIKNKQNVDIFCLQEVYHNATQRISADEKVECFNLFNEIQDILPNHMGYFRPVVGGIYGLAIFIKKDYTIIHEDIQTIHENLNYPGYGPTHSRIMQWIKFETQDTSYTVFNVHGLWNGMGKTDTLERIIQSQNIHAVVSRTPGAKILCGDFNLRPDIESMRIVEEGLVNLVKTHNITSTRTSFYTKPEKFADYILTSPDIQVNSFSVLPDEVSDHSALFLEFN